MARLPKKCLVDTNVPINANRALEPDKIPLELCECALACLNAIEHVRKKGKLVIDSGNEIFDEYRRHLSLSGQPGVGDVFIKWVHDHQWNPKKIERVEIIKEGDSFKEFPRHSGLTNFDISDKKFVAVAYAHKEKPPILQATDSKWWGWQEPLADVGITVEFICPDYVEKKFREKIGSRGK